MRFAVNRYLDVLCCVLLFLVFGVCCLLSFVVCCLFVVVVVCCLLVVVCGLFVLVGF